MQHEVEVAVEVPEQLVARVVAAGLSGRDPGVRGIEEPRAQDLGHATDDPERSVPAPGWRSTGVEPNVPA